MRRIRNQIRSLALKHLFTTNAIRYRLEFPRLLDAFRIIGKQAIVFDGGAGSGQMLRLVYENGFCERGIGYEFDPKLYDIMLRNYSDIPVLSAMEGSILSISLDDACVDCVISTQVLEHIEDHHTAASELIRIVKPGGHLIISVPHPPEPVSTPGHVREGYTLDDLRELFPESGFDLLYTGYSMTRPTMNRVMRFAELPLKGCYIPVSLADRESRLSNDEREALTPYVITCMFKKLH
jgi:SAM-dependent methyltransferase